MNVTIYDDFWEAAQLMPEKQRADFIFAIVNYGFTGEEPPAGKPWAPTFAVIRRRIEMSNEASEKAKSMAKARWAKGRKDAQASCTTDAQASCTTDAQACSKKHAESESESESENITPKPPYARIVQRLNDKAGTAFKSTSRKTRDLIRARFNEGFTEEDFSTVIDAMCDEWLGDAEMCGYLRPETLFGTKFEGYLNRPAARAKAKNSAAQSIPKPVNAPDEGDLEADERAFFERYGYWPGEGDGS